MMGAHLIDGEFKSDKYAWCPPGFVALKLTDKDAQPFLWGYAQTHRARDGEFTDDLEAALRLKGFEPPTESSVRFLEQTQRAWSEVFTARLKWLIERSGPLPKPEEVIAYAEQLTDRTVELYRGRYSAFDAKISALKKAILRDPERK